MAQWGSILTTTCNTSWPLACACAMASFSYSVQSTAAFTAALVFSAPFFFRDFLAAGVDVSSSIRLLSFFVDGSLAPRW